MKRVYRKARKGNIPDVTESVKYDGNHWRVSGYMKRNPKYIWNLIWCVREEAELVTLSGICGAIVRPEKIERSFRLVPWSMELIRSERDSVIRRGTSPDCQHPLKTKEYIPDADIPEEPSFESRLDALFERNAPFSDFLLEVLK